MEQKSVGPAVIKTRAMQLLEQQIGEPLEDYLEDRYNVRRWTTVQIANDLGVNNATVSRWMAHFGIGARLMGPRKVAV